MERVKCPICGIEIDDEPYEACPVCGWGYTGIEDSLEENEKDCYNLMTIKEAKERFAKGLNIWGEPIR